MSRKTIVRRGLIFAVIFGMGIGMGSLWAQDEKPQAPAAPTESLAAEQPKPETLTAEQMRQEIVKKNIFLPARIPEFSNVSSASYDIVSEEPILRPLDRPFRVRGFRLTDERAEAFLHFADHSEDRTVVAGDEIETVKVLKVEPPYLICDYSGREVRIAGGEGSRDAYLRLKGFGSDCHLIGTTVLLEGSFAQFYFPGEGIYRRVEEGDVLGNATVKKIEWGQVIVELTDGTLVPLKTTAAANR